MQGRIKRSIAETLQKRMLQAPAVVLLGARQVGKTTLAKDMAHQRNVLYLDLESPEDLLKLTDPISFFSDHQDRGIVLDEIQRAPEIFSILRGVIDRHREQGQATGQFLLLGSASMDLLRQSSESLAGRISYIDMSGFNVWEVGGTRDVINTLWLRGGFPESYGAPGLQASITWREDLIRTYLERDVPQMGLTIPAARLRRLWTMVGHCQGEPLNISHLASNLSVQRALINTYLDVLTDLFLIRRLHPWHANVKKRLVKSPRYYVRDSGVLHRLLGIHDNDALLSNPVLGKSWEGFVIENICSVLPSYAETYFYRVPSS